MSVMAEGEDYAPVCRFEKTPAYARCAFRREGSQSKSPPMGVRLPHAACRLAQQTISPSTEARVEGLVRRRYLPSATNALESAEAKGLHQINRAIA